jgi:hypothetical protein
LRLAVSLRGQGAAWPWNGGRRSRVRHDPKS